MPVVPLKPKRPQTPKAKTEGEKWERNSIRFFCNLTPTIADEIFRENPAAEFIRTPDEIYNRPSKLCSSKP